MASTLYIEYASRFLNFTTYVISCPQDIDDHNIMTNFYSVVWYGAQFATPLRDHRRDPRTQYALIDFNLSMIFDEDASELDCRLPAEAALVSATPFQPSDLWLGEYDYDPFAYDVGCLGNMFRVNFAVSVSLSTMRANHSPCKLGGRPFRPFISPTL